MSATTPTTPRQARSLQRRGPHPRYLHIELGGQMVHVVESTDSPARNMRVSSDLFEALLLEICDGQATSKEG